MSRYIKFCCLVLSVVVILLSIPYASVSATTAKKSITTRNVKTGIKLRWDKTNKSKKYTIYRSKKQNSGFKALAKTKKVTFIDKKAKSGETYYYKIKPSNSSAYKVEKAVRLVAPQLESVKLGEDKLYLVKWTEVKGASSYSVYRAKVMEGKKDKYNYLFTTRSTDYLDSIEFAGTYKYRIKAENGYSESVPSNKKAITYQEPMDTCNLISFINEDHTGIKLLFTKAADIDGYRIYRSLSYGKYNKLIADIKVDEVQSAQSTLADMGIAEYVDTDVEVGKNYLYSIETYNDDKTSERKEAYDAVEFDVADLILKEGKTSKYLNVTLKKIDYLLGDGAYEEILDIFDLKYTVKNPEIISIDEENVITALSAGKTDIVATFTLKIESVTLTVSHEISVLIKPKDS